MRICLVFLFAVFLAAGVRAQAPKDDQPETRYGIIANLRDYPQSSAKETLGSVLAAIDNGRIDYLLAHLTDPEFVDKRVREVYGGQFDELVKETTTKLADNPATVKELRRFLKEGEWGGGEDRAIAKLKDVKERQVFLRKIGKRWFLENRQKPEMTKAER